MIARFALCLLLALAAVPLGAQPEDSARRITSQPSYRGYRVEPAPRDSGSSSADSSDSASSPDGRSARARARERSRSSRDATSGADWSGVGALFQVLIWIAVIAAVAAAIYFIVRALMGIKRRPRTPEAPAETTEAAQPPPEDAPAPVFADALALARQEYERAVSAQDWARAALAAYRIFWLEAGWQGCVEESDVRTWRDAVRMVRAEGIRHGVRDLLRLIERVRYAGHRPDRAEFEAWRAALQGLNPREALA